MTRQKPKPPSHLTASTRRWWSQIVADYDLESHHLRLLQAACESWDRMQSARETIAAEGAFYRNSSDEPRPHPALAVERDSRIAFARMIRELGLNATPDPDPRPRAISGRYAA